MTRLALKPKTSICFLVVYLRFVFELNNPVRLKIVRSAFQLRCLLDWFIFYDITSTNMTPLHASALLAFRRGGHSQSMFLSIPLLILSAVLSFEPLRNCIVVQKRNIIMFLASKRLKACSITMAFMIELFQYAFFYDLLISRGGVG